MAEHNHPKRTYPLLLEVIPLFLFFILTKYTTIYIATGVLIVTSLFNLIFGYLYTRKIHPVSVITTILALVFGSFTIILQDDSFIKFKVTLMNLLFAAVLSSTYIFKKNFLKMVFQDQVNLYNKGWKILNIAWIMFFLLLATLNEIVWRHFSTNTWVNFKVFGIIGLSFIFLIIQMPIIRRYSKSKQIIKN